jgi:hypothetical protein
LANVLTLQLKVGGAQLIHVQRINEGREIAALFFVVAFLFEPSPSLELLNAILTFDPLTFSGRVSQIL